MPAIEDPIFKIKSSNVYMFMVFDAGHNNMVLIPLNKPIVFYIRIIVIHVRVPRLE